MKILIFSNIPAPYFVNYLNELGKYAKVKAVFERKKASDRNKSWNKINAKNFEYEILNGIKCGPEAAFSLKIISKIKQNIDAVIIFANPTTPTGIVGIYYCKRHHIPYILQSEGGIPKNGKGFKERFKKKLLNGALLYLTGMKPEEDYFTAYGAPIEKVKQYPFASLAEKDLINEFPDEIKKQQLRKELGITCKKVILYVGQMISRKGVDILIKACQSMPDDIGVYLVGGNKTTEYAALEKKCGVNNFHYIKHLQLDELKKYYLSADIFVLPTRYDTWGLVVNEAMSFGLPVITTENCVAGTQLIVNEENGFIIKNEAPDELREKIKILLDQPELCGEMGQNNFKKIKGYTYENMARTIYKAIKECVEK